MNDVGRSDGFVVPEKPSNKGVAAATPAEGVEGRDPAKGNPNQLTSHRTPCRLRLQSVLDRIRQVAQGDEEVRRITPLYPTARLRVMT